MPVDALYEYPGPMAGVEGFDYGLGAMGMGMDNAITGLFMHDGAWIGAAPGAFFGWHS